MSHFLNIRTTCLQVGCLAFSGSGELLASGGLDGV